MEGNNDEDILDENAIIYEDEVLEVLSLDGEDDDDQDKDIVEDVDDLQLDAQSTGQSLLNNSEGEGEELDEMMVSTFTPLRDDSIQCFTGHTGPVFALSVDHTSSLVCSGGQDDRAFVWRLSDAKTHFICSGHKDSVTCCGFSHDSKYVFTSDLSGFIQVWLSEEAKLIWSFETSCIEWAFWHDQANVLFCGTSDGEAWVWKIPSGDCRTLPSSGCGNTAGCLLSDGKRLCCGYFDGSVKVWDVKTATPISSLPNQNSPVTCLTCHANGTSLLVGYMNGMSLLISTNEAKVLARLSTSSLQSAQDETTNDSVESLAFSPPNSGQQLAFVGMVTGCLSAWDLPTQKIRYSVNQSQSGIVKLIASEMKPFICTCHLDGVVRKWDMITGACLGEWHGHCAGILDMVLTRNELKLVTSSDDATIRVYNNIDHTPQTN